jgi:hypothetical protein
MKQVPFFILLAGLLIAPMFYAGVPEFGWTFVAITICVIIGEIVAKIRTGRTLSQLFWRVSKENPRRALIALIALTLGWVALVWHLLEKMDWSGL